MVEISYFSIASLLALAGFVAFMIPRALLYVGKAALVWLTGRREPVDRWLIAIGVAALVCIGLGAGMAVYSDRAHRMLDASGAVTFSFLLFAAPAVLQVLRAWRNKHAKRVKVLSHGLLLLAILSLPASMAIPTAALMRATALAGAPAPGQTDNPAASIADERFFTDSEIVNDPDDYPIAAFLAANFTLRPDAAQPRQMHGFYRQIPTFTAFWFDQTTNMLSFDATDTFGVLISPIAHVRANLAFSLAVFVYKLLCALVLVAVTFDNLLAPLFERLHRTRRRRA